MIKFVINPESKAINNMAIMPAKLDFILQESMQTQNNKIVDNKIKTDRNTKKAINAAI